MLLEKVSMHTEILFVQCYNFFFFITCSFSVFVENCILLPNGIQNVFVVFLGIVHLWFCYPFTQICIIVHKGTIVSQNSCKYKIQYYLKKKAARMEYSAIRVTSFVSIVVYLTCAIMFIIYEIKKKSWEQFFFCQWIYRIFRFML